MYIWFKYTCLENTKTKKIKAMATFYDLCVLRNLESSEQYLSAKWAIIDTPTVFCQNNVRGLGSVGKKYQAKRMCQSWSNTARRRPILQRQAESTVRRKAAWRNDDGFKIRQDPFT